MITSSMVCWCRSSIEIGALSPGFLVSNSSSERSTVYWRDGKISNPWQFRVIGPIGDLVSEVEASLCSLDYDHTGKYSNEIEQSLGHLRDFTIPEVCYSSGV